MSDPAVQTPSDPSMGLLVHHEPDWRPALIVTAALDVLALSFIYYAYTYGVVLQLSTGSVGWKPWILRIVIAAIVAQVGAVPLARRTRVTWIVPAVATTFLASATFLAASNYVGMLGITSSIR